jgi:RNA polymerase sigma-70 factor (ECF subfamily)
MANVTDQDLVARLKECDAAAFDELFEKYRARLFGFLMRLSTRRDVAEDLLQETWIRPATKVSTLREDTKLAPWLFAVARNLFYSYRRSKMLGGERLLEFSRLCLDTEASISPFEAVAGDEFEVRLEHVLALLPLRYREALLLVAVEGMAPSEAAAVCNLDSATFRKRLSRARVMLAAKLGKLQRGLGSSGKATYPADTQSERRVVT